MYTLYIFTKKIVKVCSNAVSIYVDIERRNQTSYVVGFVLHTCAARFILCFTRKEKGGKSGSLDV